MPTFEVVRGDTVWGLTRRALTEQLGRRPTNAEVLQVVNQVQVPSGNVDLIFPGEQITIPVGPGYGDGATTPPVRGGAGPVGPGAAGAQYPSDLSPDGPFGPREAGPYQRFREAERDATAGAAATSGPDTRRFAPPIFGRGALDSFRAPENQIGDYRDFNMSSLGDWGDVLREVLGDASMFVARGASPTRIASGLRALPSGVRPALPAGVPPAPAGTPALPAGPAGGYGFGGRSYGNIQFGRG